MAVQVTLNDIRILQLSITGDYAYNSPETFRVFRANCPGSRVTGNLATETHFTDNRSPVFVAEYTVSRCPRHRRDGPFSPSRQERTRKSRMRT